uniref:Protein quiver n=1 Tax=Anopheles quadriannulatus TaxID=34691 RepID=A0A182WWJ4_ANOQN
MSIIIAIVFMGLLELGRSQYLTNTVHKTSAATEKINDLWCYSCNATDDGEACIDLSSGNNASFVKKCNPEEFICMYAWFRLRFEVKSRKHNNFCPSLTLVPHVKQFSYTTSTENSTSTPKLWSLERRCISSCEAGCIIIGERTKLYACTSCCEKSLCNTGKAHSTNPIAHFRRTSTTLALGLLVLLSVMKPTLSVIL